MVSLPYLKCAYQKLFEAKQSFRLGKHLKLDQFTDEPTNFELGFDFHLIFFAKLPAKFLFQILPQLNSDIRHTGVQGGNQSRVKSS